MKLDSNYFKKDYIEFLFEHRIKLDTAIMLTNEFELDGKSRKNDFWIHYLNAHKLVNLGKAKQAVQGYSNWMESYKQAWESGDDYWCLYFYAKFANFYNLDLERALFYIKIAEKNRNMADEKILLGNILYKLGRSNEAINKLKEALNQVESENEYNRIIKMIEEYEK